jgi:hypothetical protein
MSEKPVCEMNHAERIARLEVRDQATSERITRSEVAAEKALSLVAAQARTAQWLTIIAALLALVAAIKAFVT